jgi:hypothetical protein
LSAFSLFGIPSFCPAVTEQFKMFYFSAGSSGNTGSVPEAFWYFNGLETKHGPAR